MRFFKPRLNTLLVWHYPNSGELTPNTEVSYALMNGASTLSSGQRKLSALPQAKSMLVSMPMEYVVLANISLPKLAAHRKQAALNSVLEDRLLGDATEQLLSTAPLDQGRLRFAAIVKRSLISRCLQVLPLVSRKHLRFVAEALWLTPGEAYLQIQRKPELAVRLLCRNDQGEALVLRGDDEVIKDWKGLVYFDAEASPWVQARDKKLLISRDEINQRLAACHWNLLDDYFATQKKSTLSSTKSEYLQTPVHHLRWIKRLGIVFVLINIVAFNVMAAFLNHEKSVLQERAAQIVRRTLPGTPVVNAPLQMNQALQNAARKAGKTSQTDFLLQLSIAAKLFSNGGLQSPLSSINYSEQQLRLTLLEVPPDKLLQAMSAQCQELGFQCSAEGRQITLKASS